MARTVKDPEDRRKELLDIAQSYFYQKGYAATSVADIIQTAGIAKGTFYHYFASKEDMLNHLIERISNQALFIMDEIIHDSSLNALEKLNQSFGEIGHFKTENKETLLLIMQALYNDENIVLRHKMLHKNLKTIMPEFAKIIHQGIEEQLFDTQYPDQVGDLIFTLMGGVGEEVALLILNSPKGDQLYDELDEKYAILENTIERILGAKEGSIQLVNRDHLRIFAEV